MSRHGSPNFESYARTLRRVYWAKFLDDQAEAIVPLQFTASPAAAAPAKDMKPALAVYPIPRRPGAPR